MDLNYPCASLHRAISGIPPLPRGRLHFAGLLFLVFCALLAALRADSIGPSPQAAAMSPRGDKMARVTVGRGEHGILTKNDRIAVYSYKARTDSYEKIGEFSFGKEGAPQKLFVTDNGRFIVCVNIERSSTDLAGVRIYGIDGKLLAGWPLSKIFPSADLARIPRSETTIKWATACDLVGDGRFYINGKLEGEQSGYGVEIDLNKLSLRLSR